MSEKECQYDRIYEKTIDFDRPQFVKELQMQINDNKKKDKEIERLNNIINSLEQEMNEELKIESSGEDFVDGYDTCLKDFLQRLKELKQEN